MVPIAESATASPSTNVGAASREDGYRDGTVVMSARRIADVLPAGVNGLYDSLSIGPVVWPDCGTKASGRGGEDRWRERDGMQVSTLCCRRKFRDVNFYVRKYACASTR